MNIIDVVIILIVLAAGVVGFKRGVFKELVMTVGFLLVYIISFKLKNPVANFLSYNLPFFEFGGLTSLNIILYQALGFIIVFSLIMIIFRIILKVTNIFEKILKFTIILGIPSKILGFIVGLIEGYIIMFIVLFVFNQPFIDNGLMDGSKYADKILNSSPVLTEVVKTTNDAVKDIYEVEKNYVNTKNKNELNRECIRILLNYKVIDQDYANKLKEKGKINF